MVLISSCQKESPKHVAAPVKVSLLEIKNTKQQRTLSYSGTIEAENTANIGFAVPGVINRIAAQEGQKVSKGELLASVDDLEYQNALAIANAGLEQAEDMYKRLDDLYKKGSLPEKDYIDIKTKVTQAKANQKISAKHIRDSRLVAPMSGTITAKMIELGAMAAPGVPAFSIVKTDKVYARIAVPESEIGLLQKGMKASVYIPTIKETLSGTIAIINPLADDMSKTYTIKVILDNPKGRVLPGMLTNVSLENHQQEEIIAVPVKAIVRDADNISYVYTSNSQKKATRKRVEVVGMLGNNDAIVSGLQGGEQVVVAGQTRLKDGTSLAF
ncbi:efflux RND transporter periplasmic adaptor subunit [Flexibacter flexilis]|nr:efflux RND transporter periplasmic adaptor subunit [Flexibacter flexilis]